MMKTKLGILLICLCALIRPSFGQGSTLNPTKKVAILEVVDKEGALSYGVKLMVRNKLTAAITNTPGYEGYDRVDLASIIGEQNFQRTGMVSDAQIKRIGEMTGASYVLVAECASLGEDNLIINAKILEVETAKIERTADVLSGVTIDEFETACRQLASVLLGGTQGSLYGSGRGGYIEIPEQGIMVQTKDLGFGSYETAEAMCKGSTVGGYTDWRLPSTEELMILYNNRDIIGGFGRGKYGAGSYGLQYETYTGVHTFCTSDGTSTSKGWTTINKEYLDFSNGEKGKMDSKIWKCNIRAVRSINNH